MTLLEEYYEYLSEEIVENRSKKLLFDLVQDFTDRRGFRQAFDECDEDIQNEILEDWLKIIQRS